MAPCLCNAHDSNNGQDYNAPRWAQNGQNDGQGLFAGYRPHWSVLQLVAHMRQFDLPLP